MWASHDKFNEPRTLWNIVPQMKRLAKLDMAENKVLLDIWKTSFPNSALYVNKSQRKTKGMAGKANRAFYIILQPPDKSRSKMNFQPRFN